MKTLFLPIALVLSLAACGSGSTDNGTSDESSVEAIDTGLNEEVEVGAADDTGRETQGAVSADASVSSDENPAVQPCLKAVAEEVGTDDVSLNRVEWSEAATGVYVNVAGADAPWLCTAWDDEVAGISYTGDEGAL